MGTDPEVPSGQRSDLSEPLRSEIAGRWLRCRTLAAERDCSALLVFGRVDRPGDLLYLAGHRPGMGGHVSRGGMRGRGFGAFLLPFEVAPVLLTTTGFSEGTPYVDEVKVGTDLPRLVAEALLSRRLDEATIALVGEDVLTVLLYRELLQRLPRVRWVGADDLVMSLRSRKSSYEIERVRQGSAIADRVGEQVREMIRPNVAESEIGAFAIEALRRAGVTEPRVTCQSGVDRSGEPIAYPTVSPRIVRVGDMLHMEINGSYQGYLIDICRSTVVGAASSEQERLLKTTLEMLDAVITAIRPGRRASDLGAVAGEIAKREGLSQHFTVEYGGPATYVGHGIGLGVDEPPVLGLDDPTLLASGMVLTIEPGLYRTAVGGCRIEDEVLVTDQGSEVLTKLERVWWRS